MSTIREKGTVLTVLLGVGLYVLMMLFNFVFYGAAGLLGIDFKVEIGEWPVRAILVDTVTYFVFFVAAFASGKYLLTRLTGVDRVRGGLRSILVILLLGFGLEILRRVFHFLFVNLALLLVPRFLHSETATELMTAVVVAIDLGLMIVAVALGRLVLARRSMDAAQLRQ